MSRLTEKRIVITGMGILSPIGSDLETFWNNLVTGQSGIRKIELVDTTEYDCKIGGEVQDFEPKDWFNNPKDARRSDRYCQCG